MHMEQQEYTQLQDEVRMTESRIETLRTAIASEPYRAEQSARRLLGYYAHLRRLNRWVWEMERAAQGVRVDAHA